MDLFVVCAFEFKHEKNQDFRNAYAALANLGLKRDLVSETGQRFLLPTGIAAGALKSSRKSKLREDLCVQAKEAFAALGVEAEIFITVCGKWAWGYLYNGG
ncbi:MAG: hypothetical protein KGY56_13335 [Desulfobacterales bacterium]|nr:hypothetical protein [Desulfobacterales bacterium]